MLRSCWNSRQYLGSSAELAGSTHRLIHQTKSDPGVSLVLRGNLRPEARELSIGRTSLTNNGTVPTSIVVNVNDAKCGASVQAALNLPVIGGEVVGVESTTEIVVEQELPADGDSECVQTVISGKMLHLVDASLTWVDYTSCLACSIDSATEIESSNLSNGHGQSCH